MEEDDSQEDPQSVSETQDSDEPETNETENEIGCNFWKDRKPEEVVGSIIRRLETDQQKTKGKTTRNNVLPKSKSYDEQLVKLMPEFESLPLETQKGCSLDKNIMKQSLPFGLLATMYQPTKSVSSSFPIALNAAMGLSRDSSAAIRRRGDRKMSAPVVADYFSLRRQDSDAPTNAREEREEGEGQPADLAGIKMEVFGDNEQNVQDEFRSRASAIDIRHREGERRHRRLTEPAILSQDFSGMEHL